MRRQHRSALVWSLVAVSVAASVAAVRLSEIRMALSWADDFFVLVAMLGFVVVGALVVHRHPGNRIGWMTVHPRGATAWLRTGERGP